MVGIRKTLLSSLVLCTGLVSALTSTLQQVTSFTGSQNPTNVGFFYYKPTTVAASPALIVAIHECTATGTVYFESTTYAALADTYGFIVIYPSSPNSGTCWDVSSAATLTHNGGGDSFGIANMVPYAISNWHVDATKVFVTGSSSGAMMTNVQASVYPELYAGASVYSGVAAGCFVSNFGGVDAWNSTCSEGLTNDTQAQWANTVHAMYPGYTGSYPPIQEYHGTADTTLFPNNLNEEIKEWCGVFGYEATAPTQVLQNTPLSGYTKSIYGPRLQGILAQGVGHTVPVQEMEDLEWFGIVGSQTTPPTTTTTGTPPTTTASAPPPSGSTVAEWGQCGGQGWTGGTVCASPFTCTVVNAFYSQCL
ncbi:carbohydrate esterase family 1 and carbohydrate-binding module family 1 protein [Roridomyces roridus]|uniref:Carboxylic ester hydrolase n=1 Tax=Roridomyces roridus TaxID=1738132 RepID=A0AAD7BB29_9AGAR|nr:carbohydrate esterase family 1 and carbohydrate-binding module family 1 protein [Roridomyces roridus]